MFTFLLVVHIIVILLMIGLILLQKSEAGGLVTSSNMGGMMSVRGSANFMTRATASLAAAFFVTSISLVFVTNKQRSEAQSLLDRDVMAPTKEVPAEPQVPLGGASDTPSKPVETAKKELASTTQEAQKVTQNLADSVQGAANSVQDAASETKQAAENLAKTSQPKKN